MCFELSSEELSIQFLQQVLPVWSHSVLYFFRKRKEEDKNKTSEEQAKIVREVISVKYKELGPMTFHEGSVLILFIIVVLLWFFRKPEFITGWAEVVASV
jgi:sodium-dependent dicarboxylate transporter 2/3/5